jgi:hypothetical protein
MSNGQLAYLALVVVGFTGFALALAFLSSWSAKKGP